MAIMSGLNILDLRVMLATADASPVEANDVSPILIIVMAGKLGFTLF